MAAGMDDYLAKPVDIEDVERVMDRLLGGAADATPVLCPAFPPALDKTVPAGP
jgi:ActR/RegA family two-component response regulator